LVGQAHELSGQFLEAPAVGHVLRHLLGLIGADARGELLAVEVALEDIVGAARAGAPWVGCFLPPFSSRLLKGGQ